MTLYLDTSVVVPIHVTEPSSAAILAFLSGAQEDVIISELAEAEFGAAIARLVRMKMLSEDKAAAIFETFDQETLSLARSAVAISADVQFAGRLVRRPPKILTADAIHVATCKRLQARLVSRDRDQLSVARLLEIPVEAFD